VNITEEKRAPATTSETTNDSVEILAQTDDLWKVKIQFPYPEATDQDVIDRIRQVKEDIARQYEVPSELLEFRELLGKTRTDQGIAATVILGKITVGQGKPEIRLHPQETPRGELIQDMIAELDIYYLDERKQVITSRRIEWELKKHNISPGLVDMQAITKALEKTIRRKSFVKKLVIARGRLPSIGQDAELEYTFYTDPKSAESLEEYRIGRKVRARDVICQKSPPKRGKESGCDVRGIKIPPIGGLDFDLVAGEGTKLSIDENRLTALRDGVPVMTRTTRQIYTLAGTRRVPQKITVGVKTLVELNAEDIISIAIDESIEVTGNLKEGTRIETSGELFLGGNVEKDSSLNAKDNVYIEGLVKGGEINSDSSVFTSKSVRNATVAAGDDVTVGGTVENSKLSACNVSAHEIIGSQVQAGQKVQITKVGNNSMGRRTTIRIGREDFYTRKIEADKEVINNLKENLERINTLFGKDVLENIGGGNQQQILVGFIKELHRRGHSDLGESTIRSFKQLLSSINPLQDVIGEKSEQLNNLEKKASDENSRKPVIVVREKILDPIEVSIKDKIVTIQPTKSASALSLTKDGKIKSHDLPNPKKRRGQPGVSSVGEKPQKKK